MTYKLHKIGSDAELFLLKAGKPFPVCGLVGGTKQDPLPVLEGNGYAVQEDNVTLEFNIPPAATAQEFQESIGKMLAYLQEEMAKKELTCSSQSLAAFDVALLKQHSQAYVFGCEPDFCVWTKSVNPTPEFVVFRKHSKADIQEHRVAGFHIHVSYSVDDAPPSLSDMENLVKAQDVFLGVPLTAMEDTQNWRRQYYGSAGAFRPKPYGHEYRVLGSATLQSNPSLNKWIFQANERAINYLNETGEAGSAKIEQYGASIRQAINSKHAESMQIVLANFPVSMP